MKHADVVRRCVSHKLIDSALAGGTLTAEGAAERHRQIDAGDDVLGMTLEDTGATRAQVAHNRMLVAAMRRDARRIKTMTYIAPAERRAACVSTGRGAPRTLRQTQTCRRSHRSNAPPGGGDDPGGGDLPWAVGAVRAALWGGALPSRTLFELCGAFGVSRRQAERALRELCAETVRDGFGRGSRVYRRLPDEGHYALVRVVGRFVVTTQSRRGETRDEFAHRHGLRVAAAAREHRARAPFLGGVAA